MYACGHTCTHEVSHVRMRSRVYACGHACTHPQFKKAYKNIDRIVQRFGLQDSRPADTPMDPGFVLKEDDFDEESTKEMISEMRALIGSIGYCTTSCRFDISYAVSVLSRHLARPCPKVIDAAKRVIRYLAGTRDFALEWWSSQEEMDSGDADTLFGATDASFTMDSMTRKSHGGFINFINHGPVSWKSGLQPIVTLSSCKRSM